VLLAMFTLLCCGRFPCRVFIPALRGSLCCACACAATALKFFTRPFVDGDSVLVQAAGGLVVSGVVEKTTGTEIAWTATALIQSHLQPAVLRLATVCTMLCTAAMHHGMLDRQQLEAWFGMDLKTSGTAPEALQVCCRVDVLFVHLTACCALQLCAPLSELRMMSSSPSPTR